MKVFTTPYGGIVAFTKKRVNKILIFPVKAFTAISAEALSLSNFPYIANIYRTKLDIHDIVN